MIAFTFFLPLMLWVLIFLIFDKEGEFQNTIFDLFDFYGNDGQKKYLLNFTIAHSFMLLPIISSTYVVSNDEIFYTSLIYLFMYILIITSTGIRRLRDIDWNAFLILVPFVYIIIIFIPSVSSDNIKLKKLEKKVKIAELKKKLKDLEGKWLKRIRNRKG